MLKIECSRCGVDLINQGALAFSPPDVPWSTVDKFHLCRSCWYVIRAHIVGNVKQSNNDAVDDLTEILQETRNQLSRWGWGDFHYGNQPQEQRVVDAVAKADQVLAKWGKNFDVISHVHMGSSGKSHDHIHAWGSFAHTHLLRAVCMRQECKGLQTHDIHAGPDEAP